ncbi:hypothetical protein IV203_027108 [Nitzschia inconspicua]|uniref:Uncharacterized protein n=1 Tax=Nitzschia inconspicua TaxID=303405 RepID=A0A9K3PXS7_9STRA|nr:hypothetical protein IV203_027108 [Nitzschia inconspicua]
MLRCRFPMFQSHCLRMVVVFVYFGGAVCLSLVWNGSCCNAQQQYQQQHQNLKSSSSSFSSSSHESIDDDTQNTLLYVTSDGSIAGVLEWNGNIFVTINNNYDDEIDDVDIDIDNNDENMNNEVNDNGNDNANGDENKNDNEEGNDSTIATATSTATSAGGGGTLVKLDLQGKEQVVSKIESTIFFNNVVVLLSADNDNDENDNDDGTIVTLVREANGIGVQIYDTNTFQKMVLPTGTNDHPRINNNNNHDDDEDDDDNEEDHAFLPAYTLSANCFLVGPHLGTMALSFQTIHDHRETNWVVWNRRGEFLLPVFSLNKDNSHDDINDNDDSSMTTTTTIISTDLSSCPAMSLDESTLYISALVVDSTSTKQQQNDNESPTTTQTTTTSSILLRKLSLNENGSANGQGLLHDPIPTNSVVSGPAIHPIDGTIYLLTNQPNNDQRQHFVHTYHPDTLQPLAKIALPKLNGFMAQPDDPDAVLVVNPIFSSDATRMYFFGTKAIVGINTRLDVDDPPLVLFQYPIVTPSPFSSWIKPFLTNDGARILLLEQLQRHHHEEEEEEEDNINNINNANTNINTVITVLDARTGTVHTNETIVLHPDWDISAVQLNQADDCLYIAHTLRTDDDTDDESQSSRLLTIPLPWKQQQQPSSSSSSSTTTTIRQKSPKEPWSAFFLELVLYPTILIACLACQVYRMYRNNRNYNNNAVLRGAYQPIDNNNELDATTTSTTTHKEMELTQLQRQEELSAEYGDLDYDDDDDDEEEESKS